MCGGAIIADFIALDHSRRLSFSDLWPDSFEESEDDMGIRKIPSIFEEDKWILPLVKRTRTTFECRCSKPNRTQVESETESFSSYKFQLQEESGCPPEARNLPGKTYNEKENNWHDLEKRLAGKRKICDINVNVNLDNNLECSWPLFSETSDEEDSNGSSDSDSDAYSGPS